MSFSTSSFSRAYSVNGYNVFVQKKEWLRLIPKPEQPIKRITAFIGGEGNIVFSDDKTIKKLNHTYRRKNKPTNVLTFEHPQPLTGGDIILSFETLLKEAQQQKKTFLHHTLHILIHALLHLQGYDHLLAGQARIMEMQEIFLLSRLGIPNPWKPRHFYEGLQTYEY